MNDFSGRVRFNIDNEFQKGGNIRSGILINKDSIHEFTYNGTNIAVQISWVDMGAFNRKIFDYLVFLNKKLIQRIRS